MTQPNPILESNVAGLTIGDYENQDPWGPSPPYPPQPQLPPSVVSVTRGTVPASGDTTGATDTPAINTALATGDVMLQGDYYVNAPIKLPSNRALWLWNARIHLAAGSNCPVIQSKGIDTGAATTNIAIHCVGQAVIDGNAVNQVQQATAVWKNTGVALWNVAGLKITGKLQIGPTNFSGLLLSKVSNYDIEQGHFLQDNSTSNQGGVELHGSPNGRIGAITGVAFDDALDVAAFASDPFNYGWTPHGSPGGNVFNVEVGLLAVNVTGQGNPLRFICGDAQTINGVTIGVVDACGATNPFATVHFGPTDYVTTPATAPQCANIRIGAVLQAGGGGGAFMLEQSFQDVTVGKVQVTQPGAIPFVFGNGSGFPGTLDLSVDELEIAATATGVAAVMACGGSGMTAKVNVGRIKAAQLGRLTSNGGDTGVFGFSAGPVRIGTLNNSLSNSVATNESGHVHDVIVDALAGGAKYLETAPYWKISGAFPALTSDDATPPAVIGSRIVTDFSKDPTGGTGSGGEYGSNGSNWAQALSYPFTPGQRGYTMLFEYYADRLGLSNGDPVATWPDASQTGLTLAQATGAAKPTYTAADAHLNGLPSVSFDGTDDFMKSGSWAGSGAVTPWWLFMVLCYTALPGSSFAVPFAGTQGTSSLADYAYQQSNNKDFLGGVGTLYESDGPATNAPLLIFGQINGTATLFGRNRLWGSLRPGNVGWIALAPSGIMMAAYDAASPQLFAAVNVAMLAVGHGVLAQADYTAISSYLATKYAITLA